MSHILLPRRVYFKDRTDRLVMNQDEFDKAKSEGAELSPAAFGYVETPEKVTPKAAAPVVPEKKPEAVIAENPAESKEDPVPPLKPDTLAAPGARAADSDAQKPLTKKGK